MLKMNYKIDKACQDEKENENDTKMKPKKKRPQCSWFNAGHHPWCPTLHKPFMASRLQVFFFSIFSPSILLFFYSFNFFIFSCFINCELNLALKYL